MSQVIFGHHNLNNFFRNVVKSCQLYNNFSPTKSDIRFINRTNEKDYVLIDWTKNKCRSSIGRKRKGGQQVLMVGDCKKNDVLHYGRIIHELMHVAGTSSNNIVQIYKIQITKILSI